MKKNLQKNYHRFNICNPDYRNYVSHLFNKFLLVVLLLPTLSIYGQADSIVYNFESGNLNNWITVSGNAFTNDDVCTDLDWGWSGPFIPEGAYHLWGVKSGSDSDTGIIKTSNFILRGDGIIKFMIGGGFDINTLYIALVRASDNAELMKETGDNNDSEDYTQKQFNAAIYKGEECYIKLVDNNTGGWGHINLDNLVIPVGNIDPPIASGALTSSTISSSQIDISWTDNSTYEDGFKIERKTDGSFSEIATVGSNTTNFSDTSLMANTLYTYRIKAYNSFGESTYSNESSSQTDLNYSVLTYNFESGNLNGWTIVSGNAFAVTDICTDSNWGWGGPFNQEGSYHLWGVKSGSDSDVGEIKTQNFTVGGSGLIDFLIGGGFDSNEVYIALMRTADNLELMRETGDNNDSEAYTAKQFDASKYKGVECYIKLVDNHTGGWGHINLDNLVIQVGDYEAPAAPGNLSANVISDSEISLSWFDYSGQEDGFIIERKNGAVFTPIDTVDANTTSYNNIGLSAETNYTYHIKAFNSFGSSAYSNEISATTNPTPIAFQYDFESGDLSDWNIISGTAFTNEHITSATTFWDPPQAFNQQGTYHYWGFNNGGDTPTGEMRTDVFTIAGDGIVSYSIGGGNDLNNLYLALVRADDDVELIKVTGDDNETYTPGSINASAYIGSNCYLKVIDNSTGGWGHINLDNIQFTGTVPTPPATPSAPTNLSASTVSGSQIDIFWDDNSNNENGFKIERKDAGVFSQIAVVSANTTTFSDINVNSSTTYTYRVRAYNWGDNSSYSNSSSATTQLITPAFSLKYDEVNGTPTTYEEVGGDSLDITNQFGKPERVAGITGNALRTDGFSTWVEVNDSINPGQDLTLSTWVVLESYPSDEELPYANLTPSAFISKTDGNLGFAININTFGIWSFSVNINGTKYTCQAPSPFPLYEWSHIAATVNSTAGYMKLFLNGAEVCSALIPAGGVISMPSEPLIIGKSNINKQVGIFLINALSGTFDNTEIYNDALSSYQINEQYNSELASITTTGEQAVQVSKIRFEDDLQRPMYHGMPPANWTNEPHGLVEYNGEYHMFYQRTPNGPYKYQMHWGHMVSSDFIHWENKKDALWPELLWSPTTGYDMKGIWSGDVVVENNIAHAFYTCVNHSGTFNPGIAHATSSGTLDDWTKQGPVINRQYVNDFRDPYLWKEGNTWHMIIGAALSTGGGLDHYTSTDLNTWSHSPNFCSNYSAMDIGSAVWEMPVFEPLGNGKYILVVNPIGNTVTKYGPKYTRGVYWIGTWDGSTFTPDFTTPKNLDIIHGHLSPTVARNTSGQLVALGMVDERWGSQAQLDAGWCHVFSLPRVWSLMPDNQSLGQFPAPELISLRESGSNVSFTNTNVNGTQTLSGAEGMQTEIIVELNPNTTANKYGINLLRSPGEEEITRLYYDAVSKQVILDKSNSSLSPYDEEGYIILGSYDETAYGKPEKFQVFIDHSIIDVFINDAVAFSNRIYPTRADSKTIQLYSEGATTTFTSVNVWQLTNATTLKSNEINSEEEAGIPTDLDSELIPAHEALYQNYPNPFDINTIIRYEIKEPSYIEIDVYDIMGHHVKKIENKFQRFPGSYDVIWDGTGREGIQLSDGIYLYSISIRGIEANKTLKLTKRMMKMNQ